MPFRVVTAVWKPTWRASKVAPSGASRVAIGIAEMDGANSQLPLDAVGAAAHLLAGSRYVELGNGEMAFGVGTDGDERIGGHGPDLVPIHHEPGAVRRHVHLIAVGEHAHHFALGRLVDEAQPPIDLREGAGLLRHGSRRQPPQLAVPAKLDLVRTGDDLLQSEPPELPVPVGIVGGHIKR